ncbi:MAG: transposase [Myxococcales bacterium]|nr:transposase [Myxococcales bacterium]
MAGRKIKRLSSLKGHDFAKYIKGEKSGEVRIKLLGLQHVQEGRSCKDAAKMVKVTDGAIRTWITRFAENGLNGLKRKPGQGAKKRFPKERFEEFKQSVIELQNQRNGGRVRGNDIQKLLSEKFSVNYEKTTVYDLLASVGLVWISARSKHPISSQEAQSAFKKTLSTR